MNTASRIFVVAWLAFGAFVGTVVDVSVGSGNPLAAIETQSLFGVPVPYSPGMVIVALFAVAGAILVSRGDRS